MALAEEVIVQDGESKNYISCSGDGNTIIVESGGSVTGHLYGEGIVGGVNNNEITVAGTVNHRVNGGYSENSSVSGNYVTVSGEVKDYVYGGNSYYGSQVSDNHVIVTGKVNECAYGGEVLGSGSATGNSVTVNGGTVNNSVFGGATQTGSAINNTVTLHNATIGKYVYGGDGYSSCVDKKTGNKLILSGASRAQYVYNFATIELPSTLTWSETSPVLSATRFSNCDTLDITSATALANHTAPGTMTLLASNTANDFANMTLKYSTAAAAVIPATGQVVKSTAKTSTVNGVGLAYNNTHTVTIANSNKSITYNVADFVNTITFGTMAWGTPRDASAAGYVYSNAAVNMDGLTFSNPADIAANTPTTLLTANNTLGAITETTKNISYGYSPVDGVTVSGVITGSIGKSGNDIQYTATGNNATKLTFGNVAWQDSGALMTRPANITFAGAAVDTSNINFTNIKELEANKTMTLVSNFGDTVGTITGTKYKVGSTLQGEGKASLEGNNLIFTTDTRAEKMTVQEQTHNTVMGAEAGMAALSAGNDFVGAATEGLSMAGNTGTDGMATYANMGGGSMNVETGSHVKTHTWNAILALGHKNEKKLSTTEYGAFFEYGTGNYSTFNGDERGDGSTRYTGGGILGKWQKNNGFYVEGSLRAGSIHDDANNVLRDANGNPYSYTTDATYWGAHIGVGREIKLNKTAVLDLYAKYFYNHRGSVSFDAGGHYDLGAVESSVLRVGTRYTVKQNDNINYYGGLAVEHEFCGRASGFADGVAIRGADISGTSVRGEIGAKFKPDEKSNVTLDLNLSGFAGKKQGLTGGLSAVFHF